MVIETKISIQLENDVYRYSVKLLYTLFLRLERVWWPFLSVPLPSTLSYGEGRMWQVTAYGQMIHISPWCVISCLTHIYSVHITHNTTHPHLIYILYLVTRRRDVFVSWGRVWFSLWPRWAWRTLKTNLHFQRLLGGNEFQLASKTNCLLYKNLAAVRETFMKKKYKSRKINGTESRRTWITKDWRGGWIVRRPPNTLS